MADPGINTIFGFGIGEALSIVLFIIEQWGNRRKAHEFAKELRDSRIIHDYLEWLRRQDQRVLVEMISKSEESLLQEVSRLGTSIQGITDAVRAEVLKLHKDLIERLHQLNERFPLPVLSPVPLRARPLADVPLLGREDELNWLRRSVGDVLIHGQPGSGKTYLAYQYARECGGLFLLTKNEDLAVSAISSCGAPLIIVDDAADRLKLIQRLIHLRTEQGLSFRLVAVCWPFEWEQLLLAMCLPQSAALELPLLGRKIIAELITMIIKGAGYQPLNPIVHELTDQAAGRPGLAVQLTVASLQDDLQQVLRGDYLARVIEQHYRSIAGHHATHMLAAFAVGGKMGMEMQVVADALGLPIVDVCAATQNMAPGGVLETLSRSCLVARPAALRRALLKEMFFKADGVGLPREIWEKLYAAAPNKDEALRDLLQAAQVGATVDAEWLLGLVTQSAAANVWNLYASLGKNQCDFIFHSHPEHISDIMTPAFHYVPSLIIPHLLGQSVGDYRSVGGYPEAPLRKLTDWVAQGMPEHGEAMRRRHELFRATCSWLKAGGDYRTALRAFEPCFSLGYDFTEADPGAGMVVTFSSGLVTPKEVREIYSLWPAFLDVLRQHGITQWKPLISILQAWLFPQSRMGVSPGPEYLGLTKAFVKQMIEDVLALCNGHNGFLRWVLMHADDAGIDPHSIHQPTEYLALYPIERPIEIDWEAAQKRHAQTAKELVTSWAGLSFEEITHRLVRYETEAADMEENWPRLSPLVCRMLIEQRQPDLHVLQLWVAAGLAADLVDPLILRSLDAGVLTDVMLDNILHMDQYQYLVVRYTLTHPLPSLFDKIEPLLAKCMGPIEHMGSRSLLPEATMDWLLSREDERVRLSAALAEFRGDSKGHVRESVKTAWRAAIVEGIASKKSARDLRMIYDLCKMLDYDRTLAFDILSKMIDNDHTSMWDLEPLQPIVAVLSAGEKSTLLSKCGSLRVTDFVAVLVGDDLGLYQQLLATGELRDHHLKPLIGNPTHPPWIAKALMALHAGYSAAEISRSVLGWHWGGTGPESTMWQKWIDKFQPLLGHSNPQIREIGEAGIEWSTRDRDRALKRERHAEVHGYFNET